MSYIASGILSGNKSESSYSATRSLYLIDKLFIYFTKDVKYIASNDLLYAYCTEYNLTSIVAQLDTDDPAFYSFKNKIQPAVRTFFTKCVGYKLGVIFDYYKSLLLKNDSFYGSKTVMQQLDAIRYSKTTEDDARLIGDLLLTLRMYNKEQFPFTSETLSADSVKVVISKLETILHAGNEKLTNDMEIRKYCKIVDTLINLYEYTSTYIGVDGNILRRHAYNNMPLCDITTVAEKISGGCIDLNKVMPECVPYKFVDLDAAICMFPESTEYSLFKEMYAKGRPENTSSLNILACWTLRSVITKQKQ